MGKTHTGRIIHIGKRQETLPEVESRKSKIDDSNLLINDCKSYRLECLHKNQRPLFVCFKILFDSDSCNTYRKNANPKNKTVV